MTALLITLQGLSLLVAPALAGICFALGCARRASLTRAGCAACRSPVGFDAVALDAPCPACRRPRSESGEPIPLSGRRRPFLIVGGVLLLMTSLALAILSSWLMHSMLTMTQFTQTTSAIVANALRPGQGLAGSEATLRTRAAQGEDIVGAATSALTAALGSGDVPANLGGTGAADLAAIALLGVPGSASRPAADPAFAQRCLEGCYPALAIDPAALRGATPALRPSYTGFVAPQGALKRIVVLRRVRVDGADVETKPLWQGQATDVRLFAPETPLALARPLDASEHTIELEVEARLYARFDAERTLDHRGLQRPIESWPEPLASKTSTITLTLPTTGTAP